MPKKDRTNSFFLAWHDDQKLRRVSFLYTNEGLVYAGQFKSDESITYFIYSVQFGWQLIGLFTLCFGPIRCRTYCTSLSRISAENKPKKNLTFDFLDVVWLTQMHNFLSYVFYQYTLGYSFHQQQSIASGLQVELSLLHASSHSTYTQENALKIL